MKVTIIHGQSHEGSTCHIARILAKKLNASVTEFFLPRDFGDYCVGCTLCFTRDEKLCPHYDRLRVITEAMDEADVIILASPVYVYHVTGPMKSFLDHYGYRWMIHRPEASMFSKQGVCIATAAGSGTKTANQDMADSLFFWGVAKTYRYGKAVSAVNWDRVSDEKKAAIEADMEKLAAKLTKRNGRVKPGIRTRAFFRLVRFLHTKGWGEPDVKYWQEKGWSGKKRPWK